MQGKVRTVSDFQVIRVGSGAVHPGSEAGDGEEDDPGAPQEVLQLRRIPRKPS